MTTLFKNVTLIDPSADRHSVAADVLVDGEYIAKVADKIDGCFGRTINCTGKLMIPGMYDAHCHIAMTLFRGYAEDLPLHRWLNEKIFPAEERLTKRSVYAASMLGCAEMIRNGVVSFTDMYEKCEDTAAAVIETGMKANLSRAVLSFDPNEDMSGSLRFNEAKALAENYHKAAGGRIRVDMAVHAEYTNTPSSAAAVGSYASAHGLGMHVHISETESEHNECVSRHGKTPLRFFIDAGCAATPMTAAHCVWVSDDDIALMREYNVTAVHNPTSNLKLGSGVMPLRKLLERGVNVALGTDGVSSNNNLDMLYELRLASILHKGIAGRADETTAPEMYPLIAENGARSQGRPDCGKIAGGCKADIALIDLDAPNNVPVWDAANALCYSVNSGNVVLTMCDGRILYENGEYKTLDIEKVRAEMKEVTSHYFD